MIELSRRVTTICTEINYVVRHAATSGYRAEDVQTIAAMREIAATLRSSARVCRPCVSTRREQDGAYFPNCEAKRSSLALGQAASTCLADDAKAVDAAWLRNCAGRKAGRGQGRFCPVSIRARIQRQAGDASSAPGRRPMEILNLLNLRRHRGAVVGALDHLGADQVIGLESKIDLHRRGERIQGTLDSRGNEGVIIASAVPR
jgi:hypothetical protein